MRIPIWHFPTYTRTIKLLGSGREWAEALPNNESTTEAAMSIQISIQIRKAEESLSMLPTTPGATAWSTRGGHEVDNLGGIWDTTGVFGRLGDVSRGWLHHPLRRVLCWGRKHRLGVFPIQLARRANWCPPQHQPWPQQVCGPCVCLVDLAPHATGGSGLDGTPMSIHP